MGFWIYTNYPKESAKVTKVLLIWIMSSIFLQYIYKRFLDPNRNVNKLMIITSPLSYELSTARSDGVCISLQLKDYPGIIFKSKSDKCELTGIDQFIQEAQIGDTLSLEVKRGDILGRTRSVFFFSLVFRNKDYLPTEAERYERELSGFFWIFILGGGFIVVTVYLILDSKGIINRIRNKYFTENRSEITSVKDFNEFP